MLHSRLSPILRLVDGGPKAPAPWLLGGPRRFPGNAGHGPPGALGNIITVCIQAALPHAPRGTWLAAPNSGTWLHISELAWSSSVRRGVSGQSLLVGLHSQGASVIPQELLCTSPQPLRTITNLPSAVTRAWGYGQQGCLITWRYADAPTACPMDDAGVWTGCSPGGRFHRCGVDIKLLSKGNSCANADLLCAVR